MLNNLKNILIGVFSAIIVVAIGASAYTAFASPNGDEPVAPSLAQRVLVKPAMGTAPARLCLISPLLI